VAEKYKEQGNEFFKDHHYPQAIEWVRRCPCSPLVCSAFELRDHHSRTAAYRQLSNLSALVVLFGILASPAHHAAAAAALGAVQYTKAIETNPTKPAYWANRAYAYERSEKFGAAVEDAEAAIRLDRNFLKA
jgi:tetratricopeptide (TPR) repeat protein